MPVPLFRKLFLFVIAGLTISLSIPAAAHDLDLGGSKWCLAKNRILATIELGSSLFPEIRTIKEGRYDLAAMADGQLQQLATGTIQPYINERLSVSVNDKPYPVQVSRIEREGTLWKIWLSVDNISFDKPTNPVKIDYRLLFEETNNTHVNVAFMYLSDASADTVQKFFDYTHPELQHTFDPVAHVWEFSINGIANEAASVDKGVNPTERAGSDTDRVISPK